MRKKNSFHKNYKWIIIIAFVWIILNEKTDPATIISGIVLASAGVFFTEKYLLEIPFHQRYPMHFLKMTKYFFIVVIQVYAEGFVAIKKIITGNINPRIIKVKTGMGNDFETCMIANSITLVPGTISLDVQHDEITVLCLDAEKRN